MTECRCGTTFEDDSTLVCGQCGALLYADELKRLYQAYRKERAEENWERCVELIEKALRLLPENTTQRKQFEGALKECAHRFNNQAPAPSESSLSAPEESLFKRHKLDEFRGRAREYAGLSDAPPDQTSPTIRSIAAETAVLFRIILISSKALAIGLAKKKTLISLAIWIASLSLLLGWKRATAFGLMIYMHEMGHLLAIQYCGFSFAWPFFVPFVGAFVAHGKKLLKHPRTNAAVSLAGPLLGTMASLLVFAANAFSEVPKEILEIARLNALINLLNLMPIWILDGARLANTLNRGQLAFIAGTMLVYALACWNTFAFLMFCCYAVRVAAHPMMIKTAPIPREYRGKAMWDVVLLQTALMVICLLPLKNTT